jgi:hypothetical protein
LEICEENLTTIGGLRTTERVANVERYAECAEDLVDGVEDGVVALLDGRDVEAVGAEQLALFAEANRH